MNNNINYSLKDYLSFDKYIFVSNKQKRIMKYLLLRDFADLVVKYQLTISKNYSMKDHYYDIKREYVYYKKYYDIRREYNYYKNINSPIINQNNTYYNYIFAPDKEKGIIKYKLLRDLYILSVDYNISLSKKYTINDHYYDIKQEYIRINRKILEKSNK